LDPAGQVVQTGLVVSTELSGETRLKEEPNVPTGHLSGKTT